MEGYKAFLQKLKFAASQCGEKYTTSNIRRDTKTMNVIKVALCCCHAKTEDKRTKNKRLLNSNEALQMTKSIHIILNFKGMSFPLISMMINYMNSRSCPIPMPVVIACRKDY